MSFYDVVITMGTDTCFYAHITHAFRHNANQWGSILSIQNAIAWLDKVPKHATKYILSRELGILFCPQGWIQASNLSMFESRLKMVPFSSACAFDVVPLLRKPLWLTLSTNCALQINLSTCLELHTLMSSTQSLHFSFIFIAFIWKKVVFFAFIIEWATSTATCFYAHSAFRKNETVEEYLEYSKYNTLIGQSTKTHNKIHFKSIIKHSVLSPKLETMFKSRLKAGSI